VSPGSVAWWVTKIRQTKRHLLARVPAREREAAAGWLTPAQLALFDGMHVADRRHGLDVVAAIRAGGESDHELLLAGLLHDAGKGNTGMLPRILYALGQARITWPARALGRLPGMAPALRRLREHAETSARLAEAAGCSPRTVELIRWQDEPRDPEAGERLRLADEAN
jgi:hypothetical protein